MIFQNSKLFMIFQTFGMDKIDLHPIAIFIFLIHLTLGGNISDRGLNFSP